MTIYAETTAMGIYIHPFNAPSQASIGDIVGPLYAAAARLNQEADRLARRLFLSTTEDSR